MVSYSENIKVQIRKTKTQVHFELIQVQFFGLAKLASMTKNSCFLAAFNQKVVQDIKKSFQIVHLDAKAYQISPAMS